MSVRSGQVRSGQWDGMGFVFQWLPIDGGVLLSTYHQHLTLSGESYQQFPGEL